MKFNIVFRSVCATIPSVAIYNFGIVVNLMTYFFGNGIVVFYINWFFIVSSSVVFFLTYYRYFNKKIL